MSCLIAVELFQLNSRATARAQLVVRRKAFAHAVPNPQNFPTEYMFELWRLATARFSVS